MYSLLTEYRCFIVFSPHKCHSAVQYVIIVLGAKMENIFVYKAYLSVQVSVNKPIHSRVRGSN
jgi:hypothetical protein